MSGEGDEHVVRNTLDALVTCAYASERSYYFSFSGTPRSQGQIVDVILARPRRVSLFNFAFFTTVLSKAHNMIASFTTSSNLSTPKRGFRFAHVSQIVGSFEERFLDCDDAAASAACRCVGRVYE